MHPKFEVILELIELAEREFIFKLNKHNPIISQAEIEEAVRAWYLAARDPRLVTA